MTAPHSQHPGQSPYPGDTSPNPQPRSRLMRWSIWAAIIALILAAVVCVVWVLIGPENGLIGRAFLTILLLAAFAGVTILETHLAPRRPDWFALTSMVVWVAILLIGAFLIWAPSGRYDDTGGFGRFFAFLLIVLVLQLSVLHVRLYSRAIARSTGAFTRIVGYITIGLVALLAILLVAPLTLYEFAEFEFPYWRFVVAVTIFAALGTALVPLVNALFAPKRPRAYDQAPAYAPYGYTPAPQGYGQAPQGYAQHPPAPVAQPWPTFVDGVTPLPPLVDGSPDWNAYYTGRPTAQQQQPQQQQPQPLQQQPPQQPPHAPEPPAAYQGFPPPPPLPPQ